MNARQKARYLTRQRTRITSIIYDVDKNLVTHVKLGEKWFSVKKIALKNLVDPSSLSRFLTLALLQRLSELYDPKEISGEMSKIKVSKSNQARIVRLITEHSELTDSEVFTITKALVGEDFSDEKISNTLAVLARKAGVPFQKFAKAMAEK